MAKKTIRDEMLAKRKCLATATCMSLSLRIQQRLLTSAEYSGAVTLALYSPILNEVFTEEIFRDAHRRGKRVVYPKVGNPGLEFIQVESRGELRRGAFGILEPSGADPVPLREIDLLVVPGVAFDRAGYRLGYGKGFYDRALHSHEERGSLVGLGFEFQVISMLPAETHDVRMDMIVTEERILGFGAAEQPGPSELNPPNEGGLRR